jgi:hypothetical protein
MLLFFRFACYPPTSAAVDITVCNVPFCLAGFFEGGGEMEESAGRRVVVRGVLMCCVRELRGKDVWCVRCLA